MAIFGLGPLAQWRWGVAFALLGQLLSSIGFTMQRKAHLSNRNLTQELRKPSCRSSWWICGVAIYIVAAGPDVLSFALAPQVVCSAIGCVRLVMVTSLAHLILHERATLHDLVGMSLCISGTLCCLSFGPQKSSQQHEKPLAHEKVVVYLAVGLVVVSFLSVLEHWAKMKEQLPQALQHLVLPFISACTFCTEKIFNTEAGYAPSLSILFSNSQWCLVIAGVVVLGAFDFYYCLRGIEYMPVHIFVPVSFAFTTTLLYIQGLLVLDEFQGMETYHIVCSMGGAFTALIGALYIRPPALVGVQEQLLRVEPDVPVVSSGTACANLGISHSDSAAGALSAGSPAV